VNSPWPVAGEEEEEGEMMGRGLSDLQTWLLAHVHKPTPLGKLANAFYGADTPAGRVAISRAFSRLQDRGFPLTDRRHKPPLSVSEEHRLLTGHCLVVLPSLPANFAPFAYLDPPFNIGLPYSNYFDRQPKDVYRALLEDTLREVKRVLTADGSIAVQCGQQIQAMVYEMLERLGFHFRNTFVWAYTFGPHQKRKFVPSYQPLHHFSKHKKNFTFNADKLRIDSWRLKHGDKRANPEGRIPDDVFFVPRVNGTFRERVRGHSCQTPVEVIQRVLEACTNKGDLVLDAMAGTGPVGEAARNIGRRFLGIELSSATAAKARETHRLT
jgi:site-specific DNA-methyltransferase (adenine-specific)